jgi:plastocyanin
MPRTRCFRFGPAVVGVALWVAALTTSCSPLFQKAGFQAATLHFTIDRALAPDQTAEIESLLHLHAIRTRGLIVQISGVLRAPANEPLPTLIDLTVTTSDRSRLLDRIDLPIAVRAGGGFIERQRLASDLPAGARLRFSIEPRGIAIPRGTTLWICIDAVEDRAALASLTDCSGGGAGGSPPASEAHTAVVEILDGAFTPALRRVSPGDSVRWVLVGTDPSHTVSARAPGGFDSGLRFLEPGDSWEVSFGLESAGQAYAYRCLTHGEEGIVRVAGEQPNGEDE